MWLTLKTIWLTIYGNDPENHMVSKVVAIYDQPYGFQGQPYCSRSITWFEVKNSPKLPYPTDVKVAAGGHVFLNLRPSTMTLKKLENTGN
jgi:hypothetical protein